MNISYYKEKFNMSEIEIANLVESYVKDYPTEMIKLMSILLSSYEDKLSKLRETQSVLEGNHLFLWDVLSNSDVELQDKLLTKYRTIPKDLVFDDDKIVKLLNKENVL